MSSLFAFVGGLPRRSGLLHHSSFRTTHMETVFCRWSNYIKDILVGLSYLFPVYCVVFSLLSSYNLSPRFQRALSSPPTAELPSWSAVSPSRAGTRCRGGAVSGGVRRGDLPSARRTLTPGGWQSAWSGEPTTTRNPYFKSWTMADIGKRVNLLAVHLTDDYFCIIMSP